MTNSKPTHLKQLLLNHPPLDDLERSYHQRMLNLLDSPGDPFHRSHYEPGHFTASSFVLSPDKSQLLLIFHSKLHRWLQPGGHVDPSDPSILHAAEREVREEVGLTGLSLVHNQQPIFDLDIHTIPARKSEPEHFHFDVRFAFCAQNLEFEAGSDATEGKWVPLGAISTIESDESVMRAVKKLL